MRLIILMGMWLSSHVLLASPMSNPKINVRGQVIAKESGEPLEYATISAFSLDSVLIDGAISDESGIFQLNLNKGKYIFKYEFLGFNTHYQNIDLTKAVDLGMIGLASDQLTIDGVEVRAKKSQMNLLLDKKVFNIGQDALARGGSANEVLEQLPSVSVSVDGQVSLRGNSGVQILINGRPSAIADNNGLASIPAENIEKVEIITNPSARYEASGTAGIINIILKKEQNKGYGGMASLTTGYRADHRANLNLNWRGKKYNAFANIGGRYANFRGRSDIQRTSFLEGVLDNLDQKYRQQRHDDAWNAYLGMDYHLDDESTLTATYSIYDMINDDLYTTDYLYTNGDGERLQDWNQVLDYREPGTYQQIDFIYTKEYKANDQKLAIYLRNDLWNEDESEEVLIFEQFLTNTELLKYRTSTIESSRDHLLQADYETALSPNSRLELGIRGETRIISADYDAEESNGVDWNAIPGFTNKLDYYERIGSAYAQYHFKRKAFGMQIGLRNEYTFVKVEDVTGELEAIQKTYNRLFPSFSINYQLSEGTSSQLSYSRRIRRPSFWQLNPFNGINDPTSLFTGNPDIDPAYTDRIEWNFLVRSEKLTFNPALYASQTIDYFEVVRDQIAENLFDLESGTFTSFPVNLDRENRYGIEITTNYRPNEVVNLSGEFNYYGYQQRGVFEDRSFDFDFATWTAGLRLQLDLPKDYSFQSQFSYNARQKSVQMLNKATTYISASFSKQWSKKVTLTLTARGPRWWSVEIFRPSFVMTERGRWTNWRGTINLQYRFEKGAESRSRRGRGSIR